ncbi:MAG: YcaO-like family protein [Deltaproteobacteria bacterium]
MSPTSEPSGPALKRVFTGTHRTLPEEETLRRLEPLLPELGITRVANITGLDDVGIPTVVVTRPEARSLSVSQGKGVSLVAAKVSGIMESIEQHVAERIQLPVWFGSQRERERASELVNVQALPRFARPFDADEPMLWLAATGLESRTRREVPFTLVTLDLRMPLPPGSGCFPMGSNGLASGNCLEEAIAHGLWELMERDALALFYQRSPREQAGRRLRLDTIEHPTAQRLLAAFEAADVGVALWDMTTDLAVPAIFCSIVEGQLDVFRSVGVARGFGCHPDRDVALCRALCEAAQSRLTRIAGSRDDLQRQQVDLLRTAAHIRHHQAQLVEPEQRDFRQLPSQQRPSFEADLAWASAQLDVIVGEEPLYVDLSHPRLPVCVVRVITPGLEGSPDVPGYQPGARACALEARHA